MARIVLIWIAHIQYMEKKRASERVKFGLGSNVASLTPRANAYKYIVHI